MLLHFFSILLLLIQHINSQTSFDDYLSSYNSLARVWIHGYENQGNKGPNRGCCSLKNTSSCLPCKYRTSLRARQYDPNSNFETTFFYDIGIFSKPEEKLLETYYFEKIYSWINLNDQYISFYTADITSTIPVETTDRMSWYWYGNYEFDGSYGIFNRLKYWIVVSLTNYGYISTSTINIIIQTIVIEKYKLTSGDCCETSEIFNDEQCLTPCSFYIALNNGRNDYKESRVIEARNDTRVYSYNLTIPYFSSYISSYNKILKLRFLSNKDNKEIDVLELRNLNIFKKNVYNYIDVIGVNSYVRANISLNLYCIKTAGVLCSRSCTEFRNVDSCDNERAFPTCLNGASDYRKCEKYEISCNTNPCLNGGSCKIINNENLACICEKGYSGKYCQNIECDQDCNGRGLCMSSNNCLCDYPFFGNNCEFQQCNTSIENLCKNEGLCYFNGITPKCKCIEGKYTGDYCEISACGDCIFGECFANPQYSVSKCICHTGYEGLSCENLKSNIDYKQNPIIITFAVIFPILTILMTALTVLNYKGLLFKHYKKTVDKIQPETDELK